MNEGSNMFDLETKILEWRKQMLSAGIKSPVPLEELECHLRERIDSLKTGLNEADAFQTAAKEFGDGKILKKEFSKGRFLWRVRTNPLALNIVAAWFILGGLNNLSQLIWLWLSDWPWHDHSIRYTMSAIEAFFSLQLFVGFGLLGRGKYWRYTALLFCVLCAVSILWGVAGKLAPGWDSPGHYFILMGVMVPARYSLSMDFLDLGMLVWAIYVLTRSSMKNLFRPAIAN
jgi:hypothetical protein